MRCLAFRDGDRVRLLSRNRQPLNGTYPELVDALAAQHSSRFVVDGEVVAFEGRRTSFARLQGRLGITDPEVARASGSRSSTMSSTFSISTASATTDLPLTWRKRLLRNVFQFSDPLRCHASRPRTAKRPTRLHAGRGDEGVIAKLADAPYAGKRSPNWLKFKCVHDQEFVDRRLHRTEGHPSRIGRAAIGLLSRPPPRVRRQGRHGLRRRATLRICTNGCPPSNGRTAVHPREGARVRRHWVRPTLVAQIAFSEWTRDGKLRPPRHHGLRTDTDPADVVRETH